jgi:hypothetical protein
MKGTATNTKQIRTTTINHTNREGVQCVGGPVSWSISFFSAHEHQRIFFMKNDAHTTNIHISKPGVAKPYSAGQREQRRCIGLSLMIGRKDTAPLLGFPWFRLLFASKNGLWALKKRVMGCLFKKTNLVFLKRQMLGGCTLGTT